LRKRSGRPNLRPCRYDRRHDDGDGLPSVCMCRDFDLIHAYETYLRLRNQSINRRGARRPCAWTASWPRRCVSQWVPSIIQSSTAPPNLLYYTPTTTKH
jgi:hypothetical protein